MKKQKLSAMLMSAAMALTGAPLIPVQTVSSAADSDVCINEVCSQNKSSLTDGYGKNADWIELYNSGSSPVDLSGFGLSDSADMPLKWTFPAGTAIAPDSYLIVFASGRETIGSELHANFSISKNGETIVLSNAAGNIIQQAEVPTLGEDMSYGMSPDGSGKYEIMNATPAKANARVVSAPVFSQGSGFYGSDVSLTLSADGDTQIYYTTDGSDPTSSNTAQLYSGAITVKDRTNEPNIYCNYDENESAQSISRGVGFKKPDYNIDKATVVRAAAKGADGKFSSIVSHTYFITNGSLGQYKSMTVVSLTIDPDDLFDPDKGIYVTGNQYMDWKKSGSYDPSKSVWDTDNKCNYFSRGKDWERKADIAFFENGNTVLEQGVGVRIKGASTRNAAQKSFNIYARSEYGASKLAYPLIPDNYDINGDLIDKYDSLTLRTVSDENRMNDMVSQSLLGDRDIVTEDMKPCAVFLNGEYWGMYQMIERLSDYFIETTYGVKKQNVAMIKSNEIEEGPQSECDEFLDFAERYSKFDMKNEANYRAVCDYIDIDSMIDHYAAGIYLGTYDWPNFNYGVWRSMGEPIEGNEYSDGKWRFITYDMDYTLGTSYEDLHCEGCAYDSFRHMDNGKKYEPTSLFVNLLKNDEFRTKFVNVYCDYANYVITPEKGQTAVSDYSRSCLDLHANSLVRWWGFFGGTKDSNYAWNKDNLQTKVFPARMNFFSQRPSYTIEHMKNYLGLTGERQTVTIKTGGHGSIRINSITPDLSSGSWNGKYFTDCPVTVTAIPDEGYSFAGWSGDAKGTEITMTVDFDKAITIQADFTEAKEIKGDVNADGQFSAADLVALGKYLLGNGSLADKKAADMCTDGRIDTFDLVEMRKAILKK